VADVLSALVQRQVSQGRRRFAGFPDGLNYFYFILVNMKIVKYSLLAAVLAIFGLAVYVFTIATWPGETTSVRYIDSGNFGPYIIGESKDDILSKDAGYSFSPRPKPKECTKNWIEVSAMDEAEKSCLLSAKQWKATLYKNVCKKKRILM
jgi:hypothetical protein